MNQYRETQKAIEKIFDKQIFFITGVLKSGTTWVQFLLDAHPEICCRGEGHFIDALYPELAKTFQTYNRKSLNRNREFEDRGIKGECPRYSAEQVNHIFATAVGLVFVQWAGDSNVVQWAGDSNVKCIGEKTPENARALDFLATTIPTSKFIHIIRDGRDAAVSTWILNDQTAREFQLKKFPTFNLFIEHFAETWRAHITGMLKFGAANPDRYLEFRYEDLHRNPEPTVRALFEFLGVDADDDVVTECTHAASFERLTGGRKIGQEQAGAHMRKGVVGDWRNHFDETSRAIFRQHAGDLLKQLGYDD